MKFFEDLWFIVVCVESIIVSTLMKIFLDPSSAELNATNELVELLKVLEQCHPNLFDRDFHLKEDLGVFYYIDHLVKLFTFSKAYDSSVVFGRIGLDYCHSIKNVSNIFDDSPEKNAHIPQEQHKNGVRDMFTPVLYLHHLELREFDSAFTLLASIAEMKK